MWSRSTHPPFHSSFRFIAQQAKGLLSSKPETRHAIHTHPNRPPSVRPGTEFQALPEPGGADRAHRATPDFPSSLPWRARAPESIVREAE